MLIGDIDGVLIVPASAESKVFHQALEKARGKKTMKRDLENGISASAWLATSTNMSRGWHWDAFGRRIGRQADLLVRSGC